jgi:4-hydroxybenzoate polyprenyltransferase
VEQLAVNNGGVTALLAALRVQQWAKNLLVAAPAVAGQCLDEPGVPWRVAVLFASFSLLASAMYLLNDFVDRDADRAHPVKQKRPLASSRIGTGAALSTAAVLMISGFALAVVLAPAALGTLAVYAAASMLYTFWLKRVILVDVFVLSGLYLLRLIAGHTVFPMAYSPWLFSFTMFLFLSLALSKRAAELAGHVSPGRGYRTSDLGLVTALGIGCGVASVVLLAIYTQSPHVRTLYAQPVYLLMAAPLVLIWLGRIWLLAGRGGLSEDPLEFASRDAFTYIVGALGIVLMILARTRWLLINVVE